MGLTDEQRAMAGVVESAAKSLPSKKRKVPLAKKQKAAPAPKRQKTTSVPEDPVRSPEADRAYRLLRAYGKSKLLGPYLKTEHEISLGLKHLRKLSDRRLVSLAAEVEEALESKQQSGVSDGMVQAALQGLERVVSSRTPLKIQGLTASCFQNENWRFLLERVKLKHGVGITGLPPATELALVTAQAAMMTHARNSVRLSMPSLNLDEPVKEEAE